MHVCLTRNFERDANFFPRLSLKFVTKYLMIIKEI